MSTRLFLLLSLILALLQGAFLPPVFLEGLLVVIFVLSNQAPRVFAGLFVSGLLFDVVQTVHLGTTSVIFLIVGVAMLLLKKDIPFSRPWVGMAISMLILLSRSKIVFGSFDFASVVLGGIIAFFVMSFARLSKSEKLEI